MSLGVPPSTVHLRLVQPASVDPKRALKLLEAPDADWLGTPVDSPREGARRFLTDLSLPVRDKSPHMIFRKAAFVDLGPTRLTDTGCAIDISWRSSSLAPLFPVFAGHLSIEPRAIALEGYYAPPGGEIGLVLDRAFLNIAARGTARWFLGRVTEALAAGAGMRVGGAPREVAAAVPAEPDPGHPEGSRAAAQR